MIAVIFEVWPAEGHMDHYLDLAAALRPELDQIDGFVSIERFQSLTEPNKLLSLSFWRDEAAVEAWRNRPSHRHAGQGTSGRFRRLSASRGGRLARLRSNGPGASPSRQSRRSPCLNP